MTARPDRTGDRMLPLAFTILSAAVLAGIVLALLHLRGSPPHWTIGALHGVAGAAALVALLLALRGPPRGELTGVASFGTIAAVLAAIALALGLAVAALARRSHRAVGLAIGVHATLAITAYVLLLAYVSLG
jgi:O-antigen/teichoic acid export membrane protein